MIREGFGRKQHGLTVALYQHSPGGSNENKEISVRIAGVPDEIRTRHLLNTSSVLLPHQSVQCDFNIGTHIVDEVRMLK